MGRRNCMAKKYGIMRQKDWKIQVIEHIFENYSTFL